MTEQHRVVDGVLLLHHHFPAANAPTIAEHVDAFVRHSRVPVFAVNTELGFPKALAQWRFKAVVLHYSLFGGDYYHLSARYRRFLAAQRAAGAYLVAFFQDEYRYCQMRFSFLRQSGVQAIYSLLQPEYHDLVYGQHCGITDVRTTLPGYVGHQLLDAAKRLTVPDADRRIDVGYRARRLPFFQGRGAQEKHAIAERFLAHAGGLGLRLDIDTRESSRLYGDAWYGFVAQCRAVLGVEAGTSVFDLDDSARVRTEALLAREPGLTFEQVAQRALHDYEDRIFYRTISPRHFEAAAFRVTQILYRGHYSGVMQPDVHYLALEKDFSNIASVMERFANPAVRAAITTLAYDDLIASERWSYRSFVAGVDEHLSQVAGVGTTLPAETRERIARALRQDAPVDLALARARVWLRSTPFPGREAAASLYRRLRRGADTA